MPVRKVGKSDKLNHCFLGPYEVIQQLSSVNYEVQFKGKKKTEVVHVAQMKPFKESIWHGDVLEEGEDLEEEAAVKAIADKIIAEPSVKKRGRPRKEESSKAKGPSARTLEKEELEETGSKPASGETRDERPKRTRQPWIAWENVKFLPASILTPMTHFPYFGLLCCVMREVNTTGDIMQHLFVMVHFNVFKAVWPAPSPLTDL